MDDSIAQEGEPPSERGGGAKATFAAVVLAWVLVWALAWILT
jgi:hypothetical protein